MPGVLVLVLAGIGGLAFGPRHLVGPGISRATGGLSEANTASLRTNRGGARFSPARQIHPRNVHQLEVAWTYRMGDPQHRFGDHQITPLQVGNHLYLCTDRNEVIALDAQSGKARWRFDPQTISTVYNRCRGVAYHQTREPADNSGSTCQRRSSRRPST